MLLSWGYFIASSIVMVVWLTELIPSLASEKKRKDKWKHILFWAGVMIISAQNIWGVRY